MFDFERAFLQLRHGFELPLATSLAEIDQNAQVLHVTKKTLALEQLPKFRKLRFLCAHDISDPQFRHICLASQVTHLAANTFGVTDFTPLSRLANLLAIEISDNTAVTSLEGLRTLGRLQLLALVNCPIKVDLEPISKCKDLRFLWISSRYAKAARVPSLAPLSALTRLERMKLINVRVTDRKLTALQGLTSLIEVQLPNFFPRKEFVALAAALPNAKGNWLESRHTS